MKKTILIFLFICSSPCLQAHNSQISTITLLQNDEHIWSVHIGASFDSFQYRIRTYFPDVKSDKLSALEFQKLVLRYLKETVVIKTNGNEFILFENGMVKIGHQTDVTFMVSGMPSKLSALYLKLNGFNENSKHNSILKIRTPKSNSKNFVLKKDSNFGIFVELINGVFQRKNELPRGRAIEVSSGKKLIFSFMKTIRFQTFL